MVEPDLKYCPQCNDEYRAEIEICAACGINLITGRQKIEMEEARKKKLESRVSELSPDDDLVQIRRGQLPEMRHLSHLLEDQRIGTLLVGDMKTCGKDRFGNTLSVPTTYDLLVKRDDAVEALHVIDEEHRKTTGLGQYDQAHADAVYNPAAGEACCPACGHLFPTTEKTCPDCGLNFG
ncbi:MAG: hypothetical protein AMJ60_00500 [Desulfobacterales bacterium SG8_35]|nr:MAG: hypothetical protein AMJ60_00500 [Desulfobacterales bacterium SG8_35]